MSASEAPRGGGAASVLPAAAWTLLVVGAMIGVELASSSALTAAFAPQRVAYGLLLSVALWARVPVVLALVAVPGAYARRSPVDSFGLRTVSVTTLVLSVLGSLAVTGVLEGLVTLADRPVPDFVLEAHRSPGPHWLLFTALVVAVPLSEEALFRGYLQGALARAAGDGVAVIASAALFAAIHMQYAAFELGAVFVVGLWFGLLRARTGSLWMSILAHGLYNALSLAHLVHELGPPGG